jgi:serine protease AprX
MAMQDTTFTRIESFLYSTVDGSTFTQRSPIMPDVWIRYGVDGPDRQDLLLVAHWASSGAALAGAIAARLAADTSHAAQMRAQLAPLQSTVAAKLTFRELMRDALPASPWWRRYLMQGDEPSSWFSSKRKMAVLRRALVAWLGQEKHRTAKPEKPLIYGDFAWLARVAGGLALLHRKMPKGVRGAKEKDIQAWERSLKDTSVVLDAFFDLFAGVKAPGETEHLWAVHRNRELELAIRESTATVKVDAARHLFDIAGRGIRWAVIDSGIDARHVAFRRRRTDGRIWSTDAFELVPPKDPNREKRNGDDEKKTGQTPPKQLTRIVATYDLTLLRALMAAPLEDLEGYFEILPKEQQARMRALLRSKDNRALLAEAQRRSSDQLVKVDAKHAKIDPKGRPVDWKAWEPLLLVPQTSHATYEPPFNNHGTHVAGILGADWRPEDLPEDPVKEEVGTPRRLVMRTGMCPEIELYDIRVLSADGKPDEFALVAALQFVRALNAYSDHPTIHGVNLSLSLLHEVSNYACGRTPVCEECDRLVASGLVVVAAAGNNGRARYVTTDGEIDEGYRTVSITDPGNAESVITVGATHRAEPHAFGVSYFSSRGPTGDGRFKPDLVAPGEKVTSTVMDRGKDSEVSKDGTSMAAPHVSGAAALLLCRYPELVGRPAEVKRILCKSATDLGRDRYFQGAGLLDVLRALESF